jgi:rfaE bifunctional protein nucleotidyltransferase chain/domain
MTDYSVKLDELKKIRENLRRQNKTVVFTNGCFDILHAGHVDYLSKAKALGDILIVGLNSDSSVKRLKGNSRPITSGLERAFVISQLKAVDYVIFFDEDTPYNLISELIPDVLVKGADWNINDIVGKDIVEANGGKVLNIKFDVDQSTTKIIKKISEINK